MSFSYDQTSFTDEAGADLSASQYLGAIVDAVGVQVAPADVAIVGVIQGNPNAVGQAVKVLHTGVTKAVAGGAITRGQRVGTDAAGKFVTGALIEVGTSLETAAAADVIVAVLLD